MEVTDETVVVSSGRQTAADLGTDLAVLHLDRKVHDTLSWWTSWVWEMTGEPVRVAWAGRPRAYPGAEMAARCHRAGAMDPLRASVHPEKGAGVPAASGGWCQAPCARTRGAEERWA